MGFFNEIKNNVTQGFKDIKNDIFPEKDERDDFEDADSVNKNEYQDAESSNIDNNKETFRKDSDMVNKNMVKDEIDNIISSLEKMDEAKTGNISKKMLNNDASDMSYSSEKIKTVNENVSSNDTFGQDINKALNQVQTHAQPQAHTQPKNHTQSQPQPQKPVKKKIKLENNDNNKTVISKETLIAGNIASTGDLEIYGSVCGDVECKGKLLIAGEVTGSVMAVDACINTKKFAGDVYCEGCIEVGVGTIMAGNLVGTSAVVSGAVKGQIDVDGQVILDSTAVVNGNIKAKTIQMDSGAALYGYCDLAYSSVDINDIFKDFISEDDNNQMFVENEEYLRQMENNYQAYMENMQYQNMMSNNVQSNIPINQMQNDTSMEQMQNDMEPIQKDISIEQMQDSIPMEQVQNDIDTNPVQNEAVIEQNNKPVEKIQHTETITDNIKDDKSVNNVNSVNSEKKENVVDEVEEALKYIKAQNLSEIFKQQDTDNNVSKDADTLTSQAIEKSVQKVDDSKKQSDYKIGNNEYIAGTGLKNRYSNLESEKK